MQVMYSRAPRIFLTLFCVVVCVLASSISVSAGDSRIADFDITFNPTWQLTDNLTLGLTVISTPQIVLDNANPILFNFNITASADASCLFTLKDINGLIIHTVSSILANNATLLTDLRNGDYTWNFSCTDTSNPSLFAELNDSFTIFANYTPTVVLNSDRYTLKENESLLLYVNLTYPDSVSMFYFLDFDDGTSLFYSEHVSDDSFYTPLSHSYLANDYTLLLTAIIDGKTYTSTLPISVEEIIGTEEEDTTAPSISFMYPEGDATLSDDIVNFSYEVSDESPITNCTFNLYFFNESQIVGNLVYKKTSFSLDNESNLSLELHDFDEGNYLWEVECYDEEGNYRSKERDFTYSISEEINTESTFSSSLSESADETEADLLLSQINEFLDKTSTYSTDEQEALADLGVLDKMKFYKKKLLQIKLDLDHNIDYIRDATRKAEREVELEEEISDMKKDIPLDAKIVASDEFSKNSITSSLVDILSAYTDHKNIAIDKSALARSKKAYERYQDGFSYVTTVRQFEITYAEGKKETTLVTKKISLKNNSLSDSSFLEVIPKDIATSLDEVTFTNLYEVIKEDPIVRINAGDLVDDKIVYSINGFVDIKKIEDTDTVLFTESLLKQSSGGLTGFAVLFDTTTIGVVPFYLSWIIFILVVFSSGVVVVRQARLRRITSHKDVRVILMLLAQGVKSLDNPAEARTIYTKLRQLYARLPIAYQPFVYKKLTAFYRLIKQKETSLLVDSCIMAFKRGDRKEGLRVYREIQKFYPHLSPRYQSTIYARLRPYLYLNVW